MNKIDRSATLVPAVGAQVERVVGRLEPERATVAAPRVEACIEAVMARHPGASIRADARYYEAVHQELAPLARNMEADLSVLACQVDSLRDALAKVLDTREKEAKAFFSWENARDNFSSRGAAEGRHHLSAMTAASNAEKEARLLLATLKTPNVRAKRGQTAAQEMEDGTK